MTVMTPGSKTPPTILEMEYTILDFVCVTDSPYSSDYQELEVRVTGFRANSTRPQRSSSGICTKTRHSLLGDSRDGKVRPRGHRLQILGVSLLQKSLRDGLQRQSGE